MIDKVENKIYKNDEDNRIYKVESVVDVYKHKNKKVLFCRTGYIETDTIYLTNVYIGVELEDALKIFTPAPKLEVMPIGGN